LPGAVITVRVAGTRPAKIALADAPTLMLHTDREELTLRCAGRPGWARAMGRDRFGLWADIRIEPPSGAPVTQRLRWIPPGRFTMGSPEDEPGRYEDEGPQHDVVIGQGYWLFDTPCTQALWEAVMGENPSRFLDPQRPVEQVSWSSARHFAEALDTLFAVDTARDHSRFVLPSESQWEYACRAGAETALCTGPIEILGGKKAPALDTIAWYSGNSGVDFDLDTDLDSTNNRTSRETIVSQAQRPQKGTHRVKLKEPNAWGLYDMLGNVWEWTEDQWRGTYKGAPGDGGAWFDSGMDTGADRAIRGGSWRVYARDCRCAARGYGPPVLRYDDLGFRCAQIQAA
jgi:formylglycine-generating enzyme required for sulfatase activity